MSLSNNPRVRLAELRERWDTDRRSRVFLQLAEEYRRQGQPSDAIGVLEVGLSHNPSSIAGQVALGRCLLELKRMPEARDVLEAVLSKDATQMVAYRHLIDVNLALEDHQEATRRFEVYEQLNPLDPELPDLRERLQALPEAEEATAPREEVDVDEDGAGSPSRRQESAEQGAAAPASGELFPTAGLRAEPARSDLADRSAVGTTLEKEQDSPVAKEESQSGTSPDPVARSTAADEEAARTDERSGDEAELELGPESVAPHRDEPSGPTQAADAVAVGEQFASALSAEETDSPSPDEHEDPSSPVEAIGLEAGEKLKEAFTSADETTEPSTDSGPETALEAESRSSSVATTKSEVGSDAASPTWGEVFALPTDLAASQLHLGPLVSRLLSPKGSGAAEHSARAPESTDAAGSEQLGARPSHATLDDLYRSQGHAPEAAAGDAELTAQQAGFDSSITGAAHEQAGSVPKVATGGDLADFEGIPSASPGASLEGEQGDVSQSKETEPAPRSNERAESDARSAVSGRLDAAAVLSLYTERQESLEAMPKLQRKRHLVGNYLRGLRALREDRE